MNVLLVGRTQTVLNEVTQALDEPAVAFSTATTLQQARDALAATRADHVIVGGGLDLDTRLSIARYVFENSTSTTMHMNSPSGPQSYLPFVAAVLHGLASR